MSCRSPYPCRSPAQSMVRMSSSMGLRGKRSRGSRSADRGVMGVPGEVILAILSLSIASDTRFARRVASAERTARPLLGAKRLDRIDAYGTTCRDVGGDSHDDGEHSDHQD